jgi:hypothetical protein
MNCKHLFFLLLLINTSCNKKSSLKINDQAGEFFLANYSKGMIISCYRCGCIDDYLNIARVDSFRKKGIIIFSDSTCRLKIPKGVVMNFQQKDLDSIWELNYNVLLFKKDNAGYEFSNLKNEDDLNKKVSIFFKEK